MGAKASKPAQSATRKFPSRSPGAVPPASRPAAGGRGAAPRPQPPPASSRNPNPKASFAKDDAIKADGHDPDPMTNPAFSARLRQMGVATPNPTLSNSSTASPHFDPRSQSQSQPNNYPPPAQNRTLSALDARERLQRQADADFENPAGGREFLDIGTLKQILMMRGRGSAPGEIERRLRLKSGVVARLGREGVVVPAMGG